MRGENTKISNEQKRLIQNTLLFTGIVMAAAGVFILSTPKTAAFIFDGDTGMTLILGAALLALGFLDIIMTKTVFYTRDRK
jgi:uncharacterized membrane protein HdeD (DUF308 family)